MNQDALLEINKAVELATAGNWIPLLALSILMGVILTLLIYIWSLHQKNNEKKHEATDKVLEKLADSHRENQLLLERVITRQDGHDGRMKKMEGDIKDLRRS